MVLICELFVVHSTTPGPVHHLLTRVTAIGGLRFHDDNENYNDNDNEIVFVMFCTQRDERLIASISSSTTTITNRNTGRTQEMMMSAHTEFVLVLLVVVVMKS